MSREPIVWENSIRLSGLLLLVSSHLNPIFLKVSLHILELLDSFLSRLLLRVFSLLHKLVVLERLLIQEKARWLYHQNFGSNMRILN